MKQLSIIALFFVATGVVNAQTAYFTTSGVALNGYDPVTYFSEKAPAQGSKNFSYSWQGAEWHFKNQSNLEVFKADPAKYAPQFGGYCAYGASQNHKSPTDPSAFTIIGDKLYLNYNPKVKELWLKDTAGNIEKAEKNWPALKDQN